MTIKIDKGVTVPDITGPGGPAKYPWRDMEVGDSFFVPGITTDKLNPAPQQHSLGFKFTRRAVTENGVKGVRVWRIQ